MLTQEAVAAALALAGIRTGAHVLDLAPGAGLTRAARAMAGVGGRVYSADEEEPQGPAVRYGYAIAVWTDRSAVTVVEDVESARTSLAPYARVTMGSGGSLAALVDELRAFGWTVLHGTTVSDAELDRSPPRNLALVVARAPE
ncbi:MAG TPA: hypothetical protein VLR26_00555 [Frankiaceae bacterium]|nr:hypothetical protein [Frankiaceae bacterium]